MCPATPPNALQPKQRDNKVWQMGHSKPQNGGCRLDYLLRLNYRLTTAQDIDFYRQLFLPCIG